MKKLFITALLLSCMLLPGTRADEGMWLLPYLREMIHPEMQALGLELTPEQIYSLNESSLKDAVVIFGGGCTGEMISARGLLLTNHHCGIDEFQRMSTIEKDYLRDGFWAMSQEEELHVPGLSVKFLLRIEDVTQRVVSALASGMNAAQQSQALRQVRRQIEQEASARGRYSTSVEYFRFGSGGQYLLFVYEEFSDVRMVGVPPNSIGQFGGDADNWEWPNHNGDFALFRVYMEPDGSPSSDYDPENIPHKPRHHFPISLSGLQKEDFVMAMGYPGSTTRYLTSYEIQDVMEVGNSIRAEIRGMRQDIWRRAMDQDDDIRIMYASRYFNSSNYWKYSIGQNQALVNLKVVEEARQLEDRFRQWVGQDPERKSFSEALPLIEKGITERRKTSESHQLIMEGLMGSQSYFAAGRRFHTLYNQLRAENPDEEAIKRQLRSLRSSVDFFFRFDMDTERRVLELMLGHVRSRLPLEHLPAYYHEIEKNYGKNYLKFIDDMFASSMLVDREKMLAFLDDPNPEILANDLGYLFVNSVYDMAVHLRQTNTQIQSRYLVPGKRLWYDGLNEMITERNLYPDANFTMRLTYGTVKGYEPRDAVWYEPYSSSQGILEKVRNAPHTYSTPDKLIRLLEQKDFGPYAENGLLKISFLSNLDITGGNSGSPVLNARGELVGVAYDGNWEAMSSDIAFAPDMQRAISVDIRYVLFIIDKFAGAGYLLDEMSLIKAE